MKPSTDGAVWGTHREHPDDGALLARRRDLRAVQAESHRGQRRVVRGNHRLRVQIDGVEDLQLAGDGAAGVRQVAVVGVGGERAQPAGVDGRVADRVHDLHITDVVDVETLLEAHHQARAVELHRLDGVRVGVIADFCSLLEVANFEFARRVQRHDGQQGAAEQPLDDADVVAVVGVNLLQRLVHRVERVKRVSIFVADRQRSGKANKWK